MKKYFFISICLFTASQLLAQNRIEIPFTMDRNLILIKAELTSTGEQSFIFDTGTESIMLWNELANKYKLVGLDSMTTPDGIFVETQEKVNIPDLSYGNLKLNNRVATKMPKQMIFSNKAVGIIGLKTFADFMITLDYINSKLILEKGSLKKQPDVIPINIEHILEAKVMLNNKEVLAHFDCGGAGYISIPKAWSSIYKLKSEAVFYTKGRTPMGDFDVYNADLDGSIEIGNYRLTNPKISLVTGDFFVAVNFGYNFFKEHLITIDTKNKLLEIKQFTK